SCTKNILRPLIWEEQTAGDVRYYRRGLHLKDSQMKRGCVVLFDPGNGGGAHAMRYGAFARSMGMRLYPLCPVLQSKIKPEKMNDAKNESPELQDGDNSLKCKYCGNKLLASASLCTKCSKFQKVWKNWIPHIGGMMAALTVCGTFGGFAWSTFSAIHQANLAQLQGADLRYMQTIDDTLLAPLAKAAHSGGSLWEDYLVAADAEETLLLKHLALKPENVVLVDPDDCAPGSGRCRVYFESKPDHQRSYFTVDPYYENTKKLSNELSQYFNNLRLITVANSDQELKESISTINTEITGLVSLLNESNGQIPELPVVQPLSFSNTLEGRLKILQVVTRAATPIVSATADLMQNMSQLSTNAFVNEFSTDLQLKITQFARDRSDQTLEAVLQRA